MIKKVTSLLLALSMCLNVSIVANAAVINKPIENIANVVYFVDFKDSGTNFMDGKFDKVKDMFEGSKDTSLSNYIKAISYNQMNVKNYFPQEKNGQITPYRLPNNRSYYSNINEIEMISDVLKNVSVNQNYNIDRNNDGYVDNVIFIFGAKKGENGDVLWSHKANLNGSISVNGKRVDNYNIQNSYNLMEPAVGSEQGVLIHEFMHSIGYPDLYRSSGTGTPVGRWDIMASVSSFVQYPLSYLRSAVSNWISIDSATKSGRYTLKPSSNSGNDQALILKTPISEKEFFVVEYRKAGNPYKGELDGKIPGNGLIIYRVNTEETSNYHGNKDYIYVFRPGETGEGDGNGNLSEAFLSKESGRTNYGSSDFTKKISDKAITYSNGQNSGIVIENVSNAGEEISFDVKFTDTSSLDIWDVVGNKEVSNKTNNDVDMDVYGNKVYTVYNEDNKLKAKMFDGSNWTNLGDYITNNKGNNPTIAVYNNIPYVLYHDSRYRSVVARFINNEWETVQTLTNDISQYSDMIATNNGVYIALTEGQTTYMNNGTAYLKVYKLNTSTNKFECIGNNIHTGFVVEPSLSEANGKVYVSYTDFTADNKVFVKQDENNTWKNIEGLNLSAARASLKAVDNKLYLALTSEKGTNSSQVYVYEDSKWAKVGENIGGNEVSDLIIDVNNKIPYVAYADSVSGYSVVKKLDNGKWIQLGSNVSDEKVSKLDFKISNNKAYVSINPTTSQKLLIKSKELEKTTTEDKDEVVSVSGITLNKSELNLITGNNETLVATVNPTNATNKNLEWTSSNSSVATVDKYGKVNAISQGSTNITVKTMDGAKVAICKVTVKDPIKQVVLNNLIGSDRYQTAIKVSNKGWSKSENVVLVNSSAIVDALSATPFAKMKDAPVLLTAKDKLNNETKKEITRLGAKNVYIIGGSGVVSENIVLELKAMKLNVDRISGDTRYTTSLAIAKRLGKVSEIAVVNGVKGLADAVSIAPVAAERNMPIILSSPNEGTKVFDEYIKSNNIKTSYVIGGQAAISKEIAAKLPNANRLGGLSRNETNAIILEKFYTNKDLNNIFVAKDGMKKVDDLIDALSVGVLAAKENSPLVIVGNKLDEKQDKLISSKLPKEITQVGGNGNENAFNQIAIMFKNI